LIELPNCLFCARQQFDIRCYLSHLGSTAFHDRPVRDLRLARHGRSGRGDDLVEHQGRIFPDDPRDPLLGRQLFVGDPDLPPRQANGAGGSPRQFRIARRTAGRNAFRREFVPPPTQVGGTNALNFRENSVYGALRVPSARVFGSQPRPALLIFKRERVAQKAERLDAYASSRVFVNSRRGADFRLGAA
jgi:hypothetical protein